MKLQLKYKPVVDLLGGFFIWSSWKLVEQSPRYQKIPPELLLWKQTCDESAPELLKQQGRLLSAEFLLILFSLLKAIHLKSMEQAEELFTYLSDISGEELTELLVLGEGFPYSAQELLANPQKGRAAYSASHGTVRPGEIEHFVDFLRSPDFFRTQILAALQNFYTLGIEPWEEEISHLMDGELRKDTAWAAENPENFLENRLFFTQTSHQEIPEAIYLSYYDFWDVILLDDPIIAVYGWKNNLKEQQPTPEDIYSLLGDETRRNILRNLAQRPMFSREIAESCGLTPSTVSYHMTRLYSMGLINHRSGPRKRIFHELNTQRLKELLNLIKKDLTGSDQ